MYASVIIDISHENVDRAFSYRIPEALLDRVCVGSRVSVPFGAGNRVRSGYVVGLGETNDFDEGRTKEILGVQEGSVSADSELIRLAWWMKERYGSTMNQALKTVLPVKDKVKGADRRELLCLLKGEALEGALAEAGKKGHRAKVRLFTAFKEKNPLPLSEVRTRLKVGQATVQSLREAGWVRLLNEQIWRDPLSAFGLERENGDGVRLSLTPAQQALKEAITGAIGRGDLTPSLIFGVTGSGKTLVYLELIEYVVRLGRQVILLIPEIALTWQTVSRLYGRFGDRVSILNSRMSAGERYDQYERARRGEVDIIAGPRSALFVPFAHLGLIIIDEEHENSYQSEHAPRYDAREVAVARAQMCSAMVILGSATPSLASYTKALSGEYRLYTLKERALKEASLPSVEVVDLREELRSGNRSVFSRRLRALLNDRLKKGEQSMLFMNRRGMANFVSCRLCGAAIKCPHCDVSLTLHRESNMICHYCGYTIRAPKRCPSCGSSYIAPFGSGTQKIEQLTAQEFPQARVLRLDLDVTKRKGSHQEILSAFARGEADILIGTQMIVKGHDFPNVTLVGALAADLSLYAPHYACGEETFSLLTQAAGRAGRAGKPGTVIIQTYQPDHYAIRAAAAQDYEGFYRQEMAYRRLLSYPPVTGLLEIFLSSPDEALLSRTAASLAETLGRGQEEVVLVGPVDAPIYKLNDIYRKFLYVKGGNYDILIQIRKNAQAFLKAGAAKNAVLAQYGLT